MYDPAPNVGTERINYYDHARRTRLSLMRLYAEHHELGMPSPVPQYTSQGRDTLADCERIVKPRKVMRLGEYEHPNYVPASLPTLTSKRLTSEQRELLRMVVDTVTRERLAVGHENDHNGAWDIAPNHVAAEPVDGWKGLVPAHEVRVSERGATGIRGVRGMATKVSMRDVHGPTFIMRELPTVGVATHADASHSDYARLIAHVRRHATECTYRRRMPSCHGLLDCGVVPVLDLAQERRERRIARKQGIGREPVTPDVLKYAAIGVTDYGGAH